VGKTVKHFAGRIKYWGIWNEPNIGFFMGTADRYREVLEAAHAAAKEADPNCVVLFGGTAGFGFDFIEEVCSKGNARKCFDILNVHDYPPFPEGNYYLELRDATRLASLGGWERRRSGSRRREEGHSEISRPRSSPELSSSALPSATRE